MSVLGRAEELLGEVVHYQVDGYTREKQAEKLRALLSQIQNDDFLKRAKLP